MSDRNTYIETVEESSFRSDRPVPGARCVMWFYPHTGPRWGISEWKPAGWLMPEVSHG